MPSHNLVVLTARVLAARFKNRSQICSRGLDSDNNDNDFANSSTVASLEFRSVDSACAARGCERHALRPGSWELL